ncbi:MAG: DNA adenine methyltransferase YhdJ [Lentisphaerae bacterium ADurb.Bin242]|nr:MAG: DNA adenine methyltransferase YhdJ [Lentisphaerae bacterium ADurb.Bin242]
MDGKCALNNRTLRLSASERTLFSKRIARVSSPLSPDETSGRIFQEDLLRVLDFFPDAFADLMILDPPYNLDKNFNGFQFARKSDSAYADYLESWFPRLMRLLKPDASVYLCGDWQSSAALYGIMKKHLTVRSRITWQREKGRGAKSNWKNGLEDIWFGTVGKSYYFNVGAVKMRRRVIAPYKKDGRPKDWEQTSDGAFRLTHPSNFWDDISIPYWSMPENTDHPTQKPEKLMAKLILASCPEGGMVFDPFAGSGTSCVAAKKLGRRFCGVELNKEYVCWALKRLALAETNPSIQGYHDGVFWERNTLTMQSRKSSG